MTEKPTRRVVPGDWIRFYRAGAMVIGVVQYVRAQEQYPYKVQVHTDVGTTYTDSILETRGAVQ